MEGQGLNAPVSELNEGLLFSSTHSPPACQRKSLKVRCAGSPWPGTTKP